MFYPDILINEHSQLILNTCTYKSQYLKLDNYCKLERIHTGLCGVPLACLKVHNIVKSCEPHTRFHHSGSEYSIDSKVRVPDKQMGREDNKQRETNKPREILSQYLQNPLYGSLPASCYLNKTLLNSPWWKLNGPSHPTSQHITI